MASIWKQFKLRMSSLTTIHVISALAAVLAILSVLGVPISWITVTLVAISVAPWVIRVDQIHKYFERVELPGGLKFYIREALQSAAKLDDSTLSEEDLEKVVSIKYFEPDLTLVSIRIDIERKLRELSKFRLKNFLAGPFTLRDMSKFAYDEGLLDDAEQALIMDLLPMLNKAAHAVPVSKEDAYSVIRAAWPLLKKLDQRIQDLEAESDGKKKD